MGRSAYESVKNINWKSFTYRLLNIQKNRTRENENSCIIYLLLLPTAGRRSTEVRTIFILAWPKNLMSEFVQLLNLINHMKICYSRIDYIKSVSPKVKIMQNHNGMKKENLGKTFMIVV